MKFVLLEILLIALLSITGCSSKTQVLPPPELCIVDNKQVESAVFLDGSMSMQGFVNFPEETEYTDAVRTIEQALTLGWQNEHLTYYRFGDNLQRLNDSERVSFARYDFYGDLVTRLDSIAKITDTEKLNFIVSDFLQSDQDLQKLVKVIKHNYLQQGKGVALIAVKSRFKGMVYDIGPDKEQFYYYSGVDKNNFRPFYILALGKQSDIENFCRYYTNALDKNIERAIICMTESLGTVVLEPSKIDYKKINDGKTYAVIDDIITTVESLPQYQLTKDAGCIYLQYRLPKISLQRAQVKYNLEIWNEDEGFFEKSNAQLIRAVEPEINDEGVNVRLELYPKILEEQGIYRMCLRLSPDIDSYQRQQVKVLEEWKMKDILVEEENKILQFDTMSELRKFVKNLSEVVYIELQPHYQERYIYFKY